MRALIVNTFAKDKSTGKIAYGLFSYLKEKGHDVFLAYGQGNVYNEDGLIYIGSRFESKLHIALSRLTGKPGCYSSNATRQLIHKIEEIAPDVVYFFNIHGYFLNEYMLLGYLKKKHIRTIYTMLDEYPFMGKCGFSMECDHFMTGCYKCPRLNAYPASLFFDTAHHLAKKKKEAYDNFPELTFVAIKYTLDRAANSYILKGRDTFAADEAIDIRKYYPRNRESLREKLHIPANHKIVVCIAVYPDERKGAQFYLEVARVLENAKNITFVHVGYGGDKSICPSNYIPISYVANQEELCEYYSLGDLLCFPSLSETIPSTCLEALACGTPILVFDISGMPYIADESCSYVVEPKNVDQLAEVIKSVPFKNKNIEATCRAYAEKRYDNRDYFENLEILAHT